MIFDKIFRKSAKEKQAQVVPQPTILTLDSPAGWLTGSDESTVGTTAAMKISAVYGAVQYLCDFVASLPVYVYERTTRKHVDAHRLTYLLRIRPNEAQTPSDLKRYLTRCLVLRGNAYSFLLRDMSSGHVVQRIPLHPDQMQVFTYGGELRYLYTDPDSGLQYRLNSTDVTHYKLDSPDGIVGESVLKYAARTIRRAEAADKYESAIYQNNSKPGGVLETDTDLSGPSKVVDPGDETKFLSKKENVRRAWEQAHRGANALRVAVLDNGLKYREIKLDAYDASFVSSKEVSIADIPRFFMVPLHALMAGKQSYSSNEQNSLEFVQGRGLAMLKMIEEEDSYKLLLDSELQKGLWIKHNLDGRLRGDTASRANFYRTMRDIGAYSVNDIMQLEDREDVPGGDVRLGSLNYVPLERFEDLSVARNTDKRVEQ